MNIPEKNRPSWATHFMYQFKQRGCDGFWVGEKACLLQQVFADGSVCDRVDEIGKARINEYLAGEYNLTVKKLPPTSLENK